MPGLWHQVYSRTSFGRDDGLFGRSLRRVLSLSPGSRRSRLTQSPEWAHLIFCHLVLKPGSSEIPLTPTLCPKERERTTAFFLKLLSCQLRRPTVGPSPSPFGKGLG